MSPEVVVLLALLWTSALLPGLLRRRRRSCPFASMHSFRQTMRLLAAHQRIGVAGPPGRQVLVVADRTGVRGRRGSGAVQRRRAILQSLVLAVGATGAAALAAGGLFTVAFWAVCAALGAYLTLLALLRATRSSVRRRARRIPVQPAGRSPVHAARPSPVEPARRIPGHAVGRGRGALPRPARESA